MNSVETVKAICKDRRIPIARLEKDLGFSNGYISQLKKGVFPDDRLYKIADYLNVSPRYLIYGENEKTATKMDDGRESIKAELMDYLDKLPFDDLVRLRDFLLSRQQ